MLLLVLSIQPVSLQNFFSIVGSVRDDSGRSVSSVRVSLEDENGQPIKSLFADASGRFQFRGLRAGNYQVRVEPTGLPYEPVIMAVPLQSMSNSSINTSTTDIPTPVDIVLRRKKNVEAVVAAPAVVFSQNVPANAREEYNRASTNLAKDPTSGVSSLKKAIEIFPEYFDALELLGTQLVKQGDFENAAPILVRALAVNDKAAISMYALGVAYLKLKRFNESIEWLQHAASQDSGNPNVHLMLGQAYGFVNNLDQAESSLRMCYQLGGAGSADAHLYLAGIYNKRERYGEAWKELELYLKEAKGLKDTTQIKELITKLKEKEKALGKK